MTSSPWRGVARRPEVAGAIFVALVAVTTESVSPIPLGTTCEVIVVEVEIRDNGDGDDFVDTEETAEVRVCVVNNCGMELHNCTGQLLGSGPNVDCISDSTAQIGDLPDTSEVVCVNDLFLWKMANVNRTRSSIKAQCVDARKPSSSPASARINAPVQTDVTYFAFGPAS